MSMIFLDLIIIITTRSTDITVSRAGSQLKMIEHPMLGNVFKHKIVTKRCQTSVPTNGPQVQTECYVTCLKRIIDTFSPKNKYTNLT